MGCQLQSYYPIPSPQRLSLFYILVLCQTSRRRYTLLLYPVIVALHMDVIILVLVLYLCVQENHNLYSKKKYLCVLRKNLLCFNGLEFGFLSQTRPCLQIVYNFFDCVLKCKYIPHNYFNLHFKGSLKNCIEDNQPATTN